MYTNPEHLPRWDSSTNGNQEMRRYIVHVSPNKLPFPFTRCFNLDE